MSKLSHAVDPGTHPESSPEAPGEERPGTDTTRRGVRSYVLRRARYSDAQHQAWLEGMPRWGLPYQAAALDLASVFGRVAPTVLEIGFGMGAATVALADVRRDLNLIGIEVHTPGVGALLREIRLRALDNIRVIEHDAVPVLENMIPPESLDAIHIWFPDPWPKARHHKRRLITPAFLRILARCLKPHGCLHLATDWAPYAEWMVAALSQVPSLGDAPGPLAHPLQSTDTAALAAALPVIPDADWVAGQAPQHITPVPPPWRALTRFEARGLRRGHESHDILRWRVPNLPAAQSGQA